MTDAARRLSEAGLRPTPQRVLVYEYLLTHPTHPTADVIYRDVSEKLSTFSRTTVYNTLSALVARGLVRVVRVEDGELRYDGTLRDHGHFKCTRCGGVFDFDMPEQIPLPPGARVDSIDLYLSGICKNCLGIKLKEEF